jgi:2-oxoisovalerate dehydrogenase E2 component (dihydrolipoyl transacylase)
MSEYVLHMPDVGEGVAEAELVEWHVKPGDPVREDTVLAAVMTDKATVEIPSPVAGVVTWLAAEVGDLIAVKAPLVRIEIADEAAEPVSVEEQPTAEAVETEAPVDSAVEAVSPQTASLATPAAEPTSKPLAAPAVRHRAEQAGIDLGQVAGTGPDGRIMHEDLDRLLSAGAPPSGTMAGLARRTGVEEIRITGMRRKIAERMALSVSRIPHITYVEEVDVTALEELRTVMNGRRKPDQPKLTILPFLMRALVKAVEEQPAMNATFDDEAGVISRHGAVHIGIATRRRRAVRAGRPPRGGPQPVGLRRRTDSVAEAARSGRPNARTHRLDDHHRSLGSLGGIVSTRSSITRRWRSSASTRSPRGRSGMERASSCPAR